MIITILMFLIAIGLMAGITKVAQYRALGPDGRRAKKIQQLEGKLHSAQTRIARSGTNATETITWTMYAKVIEHQIENLRAESEVKQLAAGIEELQVKVAEINPDATPLELELGIGPSAGSKLAQQTIDRIDLVLKEEQNRIMAAELAVSLAARKHRADQGLCCKFRYGEDHKAEDCIQNPAILNESLARQETLWSDRDHQSRLAREAAEDSDARLVDAVQTWAWGQKRPVAHFSNGDEEMYRARPLFSSGRVTWNPRVAKEAKTRALQDMYDNGTIDAAFFDRELWKVIDSD